MVFCSSSSSRSLPPSLSWQLQRVLPPRSAWGSGPLLMQTCPWRVTGVVLKEHRSECPWKQLCRRWSPSGAPATPC